MKRDMPRPAYESVAVSSRIRLARNFKDYPFPALLKRDPHAVEQATEIVGLIAAELSTMDEFTLYDVGSLTDERAAYLVERYLISRDLVRNSAISAALIAPDESISVMINEEDHIREQYFMKGFDLQKAYERISGIDDVISESIPFAYDKTFGYLTACPTNLGTGMRASVMLFLPAVSRRGVLKDIVSLLTRQGLVVRGAYGEGSGADGELFQISNEVTLGRTEADILAEVENSVKIVVEIELRERDRMAAEEGIDLQDRVMRAYGVVTNCRKIDAREYMRRMADVKLGIALGFFRPAADGRNYKQMAAIDDLIVAMRPANINRLNGSPLSAEEQDVFRARYTVERMRELKLAP